LIDLPKKNIIYISSKQNLREEAKIFRYKGFKKKMQKKRKPVCGKKQDFRWQSNIDLPMIMETTIVPFPPELYFPIPYF